MSKAPPPKSLNPTPSPRFDPDDAIAGLLEIIGRFAFWGGLAATLIATIVLFVTYKIFTGDSPPATPEQGMANVGLLSKLLMASSVATVAGAAYLFWGEELLSALLVIASGILWSCPLFVPGMLGAAATTETPGSVVGGAALGAVQLGGTIMGVCSVLVLVGDVLTRVRTRAQQGARSDQLKLGKGVKEERDVKNVFLGKCWQLPFCRKFVRERCPIYHTRRTCWREKVGCMCEEEVIRNAMSGQPISKDTILSASAIPRNSRLPMAAKIERCRQCVIYNEHQKHKYKAWLWITVIGVGLIYVLMREPLLHGLSGVFERIDAVVSGITFSKPGEGSVKAAPQLFQEIMLACIMLVGLTYALKTLEYLIFKLKI